MAGEAGGSEESARKGKASASYGKPPDGCLAITISSDRVLAHADFTPADTDANGKPILFDVARQMIERANVKFGLKLEIIREALQECNQRERAIYGVLIAAGSHPESEVLEFYERSPELSKKSWGEDDGERVDYRSRSPYTVVKKDQVLATLHPKVMGKMGRNIYGDPIQFKTERPEGVTGGANTRIEDGKIISNIDGLFLQDKKTLNVHDTLVIKGSVGYGTGNIAFPGNVSIAGEVADGFKVYSGGTIAVNQTFNLTEAVAKKDLKVAGGIVGRGGIGALKVGGQIQAKFMSNCRAAARGSILVEREVSNSSIYSFDKLETSEKGGILGCNIYCVHGLKTGHIGKQVSRASNIYCGMDFIAMQEIEKCNERLRDLTFKTERLKVMKESPKLKPKSLAKIAEHLSRLEEDVSKTNGKISSLLPKINVNPHAQIIVSGEIFRGTLIEICQVSLFFERSVARVRVKLDMKMRKLVCEPL
ncbi:MAG: FapA family protein [Spirochaetes bacterium]|nr:FapA family protein [Spirochaetota bacterium]